jgi:hypothetical protein
MATQVIVELETFGVERVPVSLRSRYWSALAMLQRITAVSEKRLSSTLVAIFRRNARSLAALCPS